MERMASIEPTVQIASADPEINLAYVLPPTPSPSGRAPNTGADPYIPPYLHDRGGYSADYVPYVPPTDRYAPAPARRAPAYSPQTPPSHARYGSVPPFPHSASPLTPHPNNP